MRFGIMGFGWSPEAFVELAVGADVAGFDSVWIGEHLVSPSETTSHHPGESGPPPTPSPPRGDKPRPILLDPFPTVGAMAATTQRIAIGTGLFILPLRHPVLVARSAIAAQFIAGGRFLLGVGAGWIREEFTAVEAPFDRRLERMAESLTVLRALASGGRHDHHGALFDFDGLELVPARVEIPLIMGGSTPAAMRVAAELADGWVVYAMPGPDELLAQRDTLMELREKAGGKPFRIFGRLDLKDASEVQRLEAEGIEDLILRGDQAFTGKDAPERAARLAEVAALLGVGAHGSTA